MEAPQLHSSLVATARLVLGLVGAFAVCGAYLGATDPGVLSAFGVAALSVAGVALLSFAAFAPGSWCVRVLWFVP